MIDFRGKDAGNEGIACNGRQGQTGRKAKTNQRLTPRYIPSPVEYKDCSSGGIRYQIFQHFCWSEKGRTRQASYYGAAMVIDNRNHSYLMLSC